MADLSITGEVVVTSEKAEGAFDRVGAKAGQMASKVQTEANKASSAIDGIGTGAEAGAEKFTRAESRMRAAIQKSTRELEMLGKTASQKFEAQLDFKGLDKAKFQPFLNELRKAEEATKKAESGLSGLGSAAQAAGRAMAVAFSGAAAFGVVGKLVEVQREFDVLNSSLKTVTGSSAAAEREMAWLKDFAKETPFGLAQATQGFVKMKALGLDPTRAALTSFGNTASAMGKDLNQMIEAVADASTGEFERLKEFGIKAKKEGDNVSLTFQGVTTTIRNSAADITKYLENIGNVSFGGAMEERAKTLDGTIAALGDTWDELFRTVSTNNVGGLIFDSVTLANGALEDATTILRALGGAAQDAGRDTGALSTIQNGIATVFETVAVLGANLKYVLVQIGNEIGGLAAQAAAAAKLNFAEAAEIGRMMKEDAAAARAEIDAATDRILNARKQAADRAAAAAANAAFGAQASPGLDAYLAGLVRNNQPKPTPGGGGKAAAAKETEEARAYAQAVEAIAKAQLTATTAGEGYTATQQRLVDIMTSPTWRKMPEAWRVVIAQQGEAAVLAEQHAAAQKKMEEARKREADAMASSVDKLKQGNAQLREEIDMIGLSEAEKTAYTQAINEATIAKLEEQATTLELFDAEADLIQKIREQITALQDRNALLGRKQQAEAAQQAVEAQAEANQRIQDDWQKSVEQMEQSLTDALMNGGKSIAEYLKGLFRNLVLQPLLRPIVSGISGTIASLVGGTASAGNGGQGGGGILGLASNASSAYNLATGGFGSMLFGNSIAYGAMVPGLSMGGAQAAMLAAQTGEFGLAGATATASAGGAGAGGFGALLSNPVTIAIGALAMLGLSGAFSRKHEQHNLQGTFGGATGFEGNWHDYYRGGLFRSSKTVDTPLEADFLKGLQDAWNAQEAAVTSYAQALGLATDSIAGFTYDVNIKLKDLDPKAGDYQQQLMARVADAIKAGSNEMAQQLIGSWDTVQETVTRHVQQFGDDGGFAAVEETITRQTYVASEFAREGESAIDTLTRLGSSLQAVNSVFDTLGYTLLSASLASGDLASKLIDAIGGGDAFSQLTATYWQQFYSEGERQATVRRQIEGKLGDIGLAMPATRAEYRAMVEALDLTSEAGRTAFATMMQLAGAFAEVTQSAEEAAQAQAQALRENTDRAWEALQRLYQAQIDNWRKLASEADGIFRLSLDAARRLRGEVAQTVASDAAAGNAYIDSALAALRATGALPDREELSRAIDAARGGLDMSQYGTVAEYERDKLLLAGKLGEIADASGVQMSFAEQQVDLLEKQNNYWRDQIDLLRKTDLSITSIDDGVRYLVDAMKTEQAAKEAAEQAAQEAAEEAARRAMRGGGGPGVWGGGGGGEIPLRTIDWDSGEYWYPDGSGGRLSEEELRFFKDRRDHPERYPFPFYAAGGYYPGGLALVGEQGPEIINFRQPGQIYNANQTMALLGGAQSQAELVAEVRALRADVAMLRRTTERGAAASEGTHSLLDRVTAGGNAMLTEAA